MRFLSHVTRVGDPGWPGNPTLAIRPFSLTERGDVANTYTLHWFNHFGTHMDAPNHFNPDGPRLAALGPEFFVYRRLYLLDQPLGESELLRPEHLAPHDLAEVDCLLVRSGFERYRTDDPVAYAERGPGISSEAASYLMERCPRLKALILDWISVSAYQKREDGFRAHRILAGAEGHGRFVLAVEDATLKELPATPAWVVALPVRVAGIDGGPCTVLAG